MKTGDEFFDSQEFLDTLSTYEDARQNGKPHFLDIEELTDIADYYNFVGKPDDAQGAIDQAREKDPGAPGPLMFMARKALGNDDIDTAKAYVGQIADKTGTEYHYISAEILVAQNRLDEADEYLDTFFATLDTDDGDDFAADIASMYSEYGLHEKAYEWLMLVDDTQSPFYKETLARTLIALGRPKESIPLLNQLIDTYPYSKIYWAAMGDAYFAMRDYQSSLSSYEYAMAIDPDDPPAIIGKGKSLSMLDNDDEAIGYFKRYQELMPDDELGPYSEGVSLYNTGKHAEAAQAQERALALSKPYSNYRTEIYRQLLYNYHAINDAEGILRSLDAAKADGNYDPDFDIIRGYLLLSEGNKRQATRLFKRLLKQEDDASHLLFKAAVAYIENEMPEEGYELLKHLYAKYGVDHPHGHSYMAFCCFHLGRAPEMIRHLELAAELNPTELKTVFGSFIPDDIPPEKYPDYIRSISKRPKK